MKPFLLVQLRPETDAADSEYRAFLDKGGLGDDDVVRLRLDRETLPSRLRLDDFAGLIVGGGPGCVSDPPETKSPLDARMEAQVGRLTEAAIAADFPYLGCCYGIGILAHRLGAPVARTRWSEPVGTADCALTEEGRDDALLKDCPERFAAFVGHKEAVQALPPGARHLVTSPTCRFQMIRHGRHVYATQFHPEADAAEFELRIRIYREHGYFDPDDADRRIALCRAADVTAPQTILRNFVARYG